MENMLENVTKINKLGSGSTLNSNQLKTYQQLWEFRRNTNKQLGPIKPAKGSGSVC